MRRFAVASIILLLLGSCRAGPVDAGSTTSSIVTTSVTSGPTSTSSPGRSDQSAIYLFFEGYPVAPGPYLVAVSRSDELDLKGALTALLEGATVEESDMGLSSTIPPGTELLGVEVTDGVAYVDLSREFESGGGSLSMMGRVAQIVFTATRFDDVEAVRFMLEGDELDVLGGEGLIIDEPQTREAWSGLLPPIIVEEPSWGATVGTDVEIAGTAEIESGEVSFVIVDADGLIIADGETESSPGERSAFHESVVLDQIPNPGLGSVIVWEWAPDGSQRHVLEYPLSLVEG